MNDELPIDQTPGSGRSPRLRTLLLGAGLVLWASTAFFTVDEKESALVTRFGRAQTEIRSPGLNFKLPWPIDDVVRLDRRLLIFDGEPTEMLTRDKKNVLLDSFLCWRVEDPQRFARTVRTRLEAEARLLDLSTAELGAAVGLEPMEHFLNADAGKVKLKAIGREVAARIDQVARENFGIAVVDLQINGFNLPLQNRSSVIQRMRAERSRIATAYRSQGEEEALKIEAMTTAQRDLILAEASGQAAALRGQGEAEAWRALSAAYAADPELFRFLRSLEAYEKIIDENTTIFLPADSKLLKALEGP